MTQRTLLEALFDGVASTVGLPLGIRRYLQAVPPPVPPVYEATASAQSPAPLHRWVRSHCDRGFSWRQGGNAIAGGRVVLQSLASLVIETHEVLALNIRNITRLSSSKTDLADYPSLDAMAAEAPRAKHFWEMTHNHETFEALWSSVEARVEGGPFDHFSWARGCGLVNTDGSHRFVMARYLAGLLRREEYLSGNCRSWDVSPGALVDLNRSVQLYWLPEDFLDLFDRLDWFGSRFGIIRLEGWPGEPARHLLALPLSEGRARKVICCLNEAGWRTFNSYVLQLIDSSQHERLE